MTVEELQVKFTAATDQFKAKTDEMSKQLNDISEVSEKSKKDLEKAMSNPGEKAQKLAKEMTRLSAAFVEEKNRIFEAQEKIEEYDGQMQKLSEAHKMQTAEADRARQRLSDLKKEYSGLKAVIERFGTKVPLSDQLENAKKEFLQIREEAADLQSDIEKIQGQSGGRVLFNGQLLDEKAAQQQLEKMKAKLKKINIDGFDLQRLVEEFNIDKPAAELKKLEKDISGAEKTYKQMSAEASKSYDKISELAGKAASENRKIEKSQPKLKQMQSSIRNVSSQLSKLSGFKNVGKKIGNALASGFSVAGNAVSKLGKLVSAAASKLRSMSGHSNALTSSFKKLTLAAGGLMLIKSVFGRLKSIVSEYLNSNEQLKSKVEGLKAAFGQALAPAINVVVSAFDKLAPYLLTVSNLISDLFEKLGAFMGLKQTSAALSSVAKSTKEVAKAQNELYGFDKITKQSDDNSTGSNSSGTSSAAKYEPAELGSFADRIKEAIENGDWAGAGQLLGQKANSLIEKINFSKIGEKVGSTLQTGFEAVYNLLDTIDFEKIGNGAADMLNGIMDKVDFNLAGATFAKKWTALTDTLYGFVTTFDWKKFGTSISGFINGWFDEIDFAKAGETPGESVKGLLDTIVTAIENIKWQEIGDKCADFIRNIDWSGIIQRISEGLGAAIGGNSALIWGLIKDAVDDIKDYFNKYTEDAGGNIVKGVFNGIVDALKNVGTWIKEHIFQPFMDGLKSAFGIHSPSTKMAEMGGYIIDGLKNGLGDIWSKVKDKFKALWNGISDWFETKKDDLAKKWSKFTSVIKDITASIKAKFADKVSDIKAGWKKRSDEVRSKTVDFKAKFADRVSDIKESWRKRMDVINDKTAKVSLTVSDGVTGILKKIINGIVETLNKGIRAINKILPGNMKIGEITPPRLATGTVVPANFGETPVFVGDNKREIEVVSPLSTIKRAMYEVVGDRGNSDSSPRKLIIPIYFGTRKISEIVIDDINKQTESTGVCPLRV